MRKTLLESLTHGSLTEPAPPPDASAQAEHAAKVDRAVVGGDLPHRLRLLVHRVLADPVKLEEQGRRDHVVSL